MSDNETQDNAPQQEESKTDEFGNLKAEMNRKLSNTESQMAELKKLNEALLNQVDSLNHNYQQTRQQQTEQSSPSVSDLLFDNPDKAIELIEKRTEERLNRRLQESQAQQQRQNQVIGQLVSEYPELSDANNDLTKKTVEIFESLPPEEKNSPLAYKIAARDAAAQLGVLPKSKRQATDGSSDSFTFGGSGSAPAKKRDNDDLPEATKAFAKAMGLDISDEKRIERMKSTYKNRKRKGEKFS